MTDLEDSLISRLNVRQPTEARWVRLRHLAAFWQHFAFHRRVCQATGESLISVFRPDCPYPVWKRSLWIEKSDPPSAEYDLSRPFFEQLWDLFQKCPIPHMTGLGSENCEYCDDWWNSKNCYLCHSGVNCQDCLSCYRCIDCKDCRTAIFSFSCELCTEVLQAHTCYNVLGGTYVRQCRDSEFLFDCRNCHDCLLCWNLRNKSYCFRNQQLSPEEYKRVRAEYELESYSTYSKLKNEFNEILRTKAWWKALDQERCHDTSGCFIENLNNCEDCYFLSETNSCVNCTRGAWLKDCYDTFGCWNGELLFNCTLVGDKRSYHVHNSYDITDSSFLDYCGFCVRCENCFACCGLIGKRFCILNRQYTEQEYFEQVARIRQVLMEQNLYGQFFPGYFSPCPYEESIAAVHFPLSLEDARQAGFRVSASEELINSNTSALNEIPDRVVDSNDATLLKKTFLDPHNNKRFSISKADLAFARKLKVPLPRGHYLRTIRELFSVLFFNGSLREDTCALSGKSILTNLPKELSGRILSEEAYQKEVI